MILVTGGTGGLGAVMVPALAAAGHDLRVLTRSAGVQVPAGCETSVGDLRDGSAVRRALQGCSAVVAAATGFVGGRGAGPREIDGSATAMLVDEAAGAGIERFVLVSARGASATSPLDLYRAKAVAEERLRATSMAWTVLRPTVFLETWMTITRHRMDAGGPALVLGDGANPVNLVSVADVARVVVRAVGGGYDRQVVEVAGPDNLTLTELAAALGATEVKHVPQRALAVMRYAARPFSPSFARKAVAAVEMNTSDMTSAPGPAGCLPTRTAAEAIALAGRATA